MARPTASPAAGWDPDDIVLQVNAEPAVAWVGQRVTLRIDVLSPDGWAQITHLGEAAPEGAILLRDRGQGARLQQSIDGVAHTGQRYEHSMYPQRAGSIRIPAMEVDISVKTWGASPTETMTRRTTAAITLQARLPPGAPAGGLPVVTPRLQATQSWAPADGPLAVGDALVRTIRLAADDVSAMVLRPLRYPPVDGLGIYPAEPAVEDRRSRGAIRGLREEAVTYIIEQPGEYLIPAIRIAWWDPRQARLAVETLPGRTLSISAPPAHATPEATVDELDAGRRPALTALLAALAGVALALLGVRWWRGRPRPAAEPRLFRDATRAARRGDPRAALRACMLWLDHVNRDPRPARLDAFLQRHGTPDASRAAEEFLADLGTPVAARQRRAFIQGLRDARRHWRSTHRSARRSPSVALPDLNPAGGDPRRP
jgi:hypothetical protein